MWKIAKLNYPNLFWSDSGWVEKSKSSTFSNIQKQTLTLPDNGIWLEHQVDPDIVLKDSAVAFTKESYLDQRKYDSEGNSEIWNDDYNRSYYGD